MGNLRSGDYGDYDYDHYDSDESFDLHYDSDDYRRPATRYPTTSLAKMLEKELIRECEGKSPDVQRIKNAQVEVARRLNAGTLEDLDRALQHLNDQVSREWATSRPKRIGGEDWTRMVHEELAMRGMWRTEGAPGNTKAAPNNRQGKGKGKGKGGDADAGPSGRTSGAPIAGPSGGTSSSLRTESIPSLPIRTKEMGKGKGLNANAAPFVPSFSGPSGGPAKGKEAAK